jgi:hypothetical protein
MVGVIGFSLPQATTVANLIEQIQFAPNDQTNEPFHPNGGFNSTFDTNGLWLEASNEVTGLGLRLHNPIGDNYQLLSDIPLILFGGHQTLPRTLQCQLDSEGRGDENIDFSRLDFLKVARGDLRLFSQFILGQALPNPFAAHVGAKDLNPFPFFF